MTQDPIIIGLTGRAHTGKDTAADHLVREYGFVRVAFADTLRSMLEALLADAGVAPDCLHDPRLKSLAIAELHGATARQLMQTLGTEWGRNLVHGELWVTLLARRMGVHAGGTPVHDRIVVTDVRFPNECQLIKEAGGVIVRIERSSVTAMDHVSERALDNYTFDYTIYNDGTVYELHRKVLDLANHQSVKEIRRSLVP
jgi:hypothetical protein